MRPNARLCLVSFGLLFLRLWVYSYASPSDSSPTPGHIYIVFQKTASENATRRTAVSELKRPLLKRITVTNL